jgi:hypothetical protein
MNKSNKPNVDQSVRIHGDVVQMARTIVSFEGGSLSDLVSATCREIFRKKIEAAIAANKILPAPTKENRRG